jgi:hypothetical protein
MEPLFRKGQMVKVPSHKHPIRIESSGEHYAIGKAIAGRGKDITFIQNIHSENVAVMRGAKTLDWMKNPRMSK